MAEPRLLKLQSPAYGDPIFYKWPLVVTKKLDEPTEIAETIRLVCDDFPELKYAVENVILKDYDAKDYDSMNQLCQRYNKAIRNILSLWKGRAPPPRMFQPPNKELLRHIINLCYSHAIKEPEKLNLYEPFSPEVYGETSFDMVAQIVEEIQVSSEQSFLDLGSGVGQVVLQAAASNLFKECIGVEKSDTPAEFAKLMEVEFKKWMDWFGKIYTDFTLEKGDFLDDKWKDLINECGIVFVNNFAFGPVVNHHLKSRFQTMKEGSKVISSREFVPMNFKFNKRNLSELGAMIRVTEIKPKGEAATVSWTGNSVSYFLHVVDRTRLEKYFSILKKKKEGQDLDEDEMSLCSESNNSVDTTGTPLDIETLEENLDDLYLGTTTRHQWQLLTDTINQSKQDLGGKVMPGREAKTRGRIKLTQQVLVRKSGKLQMKNKILQKYGHQKPKKKPILPSQDSLDSSDSLDLPKKKSMKEKKIVKMRQEYKEKKVKQKEVTHLKDKTKLIKLKPGRKRLVNQRLKRLSSTEPSDSDTNIPLKPTTKPTIVIKRESQGKPQNNAVEEEVDKFLAGMKVRYLEFIKRINMKEYAERLKVMIECEMAKKKLLTQEINETERMVQNLISESLRNFSSRLVELDLAVKTPLDLLSKSSVLAEKHQELENKVVNMEIEVFNLEEKYKILCAARNQKNRKFGLEPMIDSDPDEVIQEYGKTDRKKELETKLCGAILTALNHRRSLMDQQSSLSEQISILEKISHTDGQNSREISAQLEEKDAVKMDEKPSRPKPRPVAFVPPRMLSANKKNTISPEARRDSSVLPDESSRTRRVRRRKRSKTTEEQTQSPSAQSDSSQGSKTDLEDRSPSTTIRSGRSVSLIDPTSTIFQQMSHTDQRYITYQAQEERAPITFPRNPIDGLIADNMHPSGMKSTKQFLKTSGKLLNAAPNTWSSFEDNQQGRFSSVDQLQSMTNNIQSPLHNDSPPGNICSDVKRISDCCNIPCSFHENDVCKRQQLSVIASDEKKSRMELHSLSSSEFSVPINSLLSYSSLQFETSRQMSRSVTTSSSLSLLSGNESLPTPDVSKSVSQDNPPVVSKPSESPTYGVSVNATSNTKPKFVDTTPNTSFSSSEATTNIKDESLPSICQLQRRDDVGRNQSQLDGPSQRDATNSFHNWLQCSGASVRRNPSSVWTSSTFSVTQLQPPKATKKSINDTPSSIPVSQVISNSKTITSLSSISKNNNQASHATANSYHSNLPSSFSHVYARDSSTINPSLNEDLALQMTNFFPVSNTYQPPEPPDEKVQNSSPQCKNEVDKQVVKHKGRKPKVDNTKQTMDVIHLKNVNDRYHYPFAMLPSENVRGGRGPPLSDAGMKRKLEESFHRQYTNPDVEDHFRTTFTKFRQNANRESLNSILEKGKVVKSSPEKSTTISVFSANIVNQGSSYLSSHHLIPAGEVISSSTNSKHLDVPGLHTTRPHSMNEKGAMVLFASDKPIPYPRSPKDRPETPLRDHHIRRSPPPTGIPLYDKSNVTTSNQNFSFSSGVSATPLYCPSTMKLLKSNFDSNVPSSNLLIPAKGNPNDMPSSYTKMAGFPHPSPKTTSGTMGAHQESMNNQREPRKPNPDMFLNAFSGGTFIPPTVPGGRPTFIPSVQTVMQDTKGHPTADTLLRAPLKKVRGRRPKSSVKKSPVTSTVGIPDSTSHIDFSKSPTNSANIPIFNPPPNNIINAGFRPPVIRNSIPPVPSPRPLSLGVRGLRPYVSNMNTQPHPSITNKMVVQRPAAKGSPPNKNPHPVNTVTIQQTASPGSPTYNHPRFVLVNMPTVMMVSTPSSDTNQVLQRQHSMTSPTFPPPNS